MVTTIRFNVNAGRYINEKGKFIKESFVVDTLDAYRQQVKQQVEEDLLQFQQDGNYDNLLDNVASKIKQNAVVEYVVGKGGVKQLQPEDISNINTHLKNELKLNFSSDGSTYGLEEVIAQLENGEISYAQARARILSYVKGSRKTYYLAVDSRTDLPYMKRELHGDNHCAECVAYASVGMVKKGNLPLPGQSCSCRSNCNCTVSYHSERQYKQWIKQQLNNFSDSVVGIA